MVDIGPILKDGIDDWLQASSRRTLRILERLSGVSYSTLRRIHTKSHSPSQENVIPLCEVIFDRPKTVEVLSQISPDLVNFFKNAFMPNDTENLNTTDEEGLLKDPEAFLVFSYCVAAEDATMSDIRDLWGRRGLKVLNHLVDADLLLERDGKISGGKEKVSFNGTRYAKPHIEALLDEYDHDNEPLGAATYYNVWSVDDDTYDELLKLHGEYTMNQGKLLSEAKNGTKVFYSASFVNLIAPKGNSDDL